MLPALTTAVGLPFALAVLALLLPSRWGRHLVLLGPAGVAAAGGLLWGETAGPTRRVVLGSWLPDLGVDLAFVVDRLGAFFLLLIGVVGLAIFQYARAYFGPGASRSFWALLLLFTGAMAGLVVSDSLILFYVFWELTTVASALLVAGDGTSGEARRGAVQAFLVTGLGGLALLAGIVLLDATAGTLDFSRLAARRAEILADPRHLAALGLMLAGALAKSAQFPFHFWLPGAMAAPTPVSAYLHSATMVQAGVVLVARLLPAFGDSPLWLPLLTGVGLATFVIAGWSALRSWDLKRLLAFSTSAYLGLVMAYYGYAGPAGLHDDLVLIANHALYKSALFLLVGWIEKITGTRDLRTLAPERWVMHVPFGAALFAVGVLAMAGTPLLLGFASKELFLTAMLEGGTQIPRWVPSLAATAANALAFAYALKFGNVFFGPEPPLLARGHPRHEVSAWLVVIPALLLVPQLVGGLAPRWLAETLEPGTHLEGGPAFWHHLDLELGLSLAGYLLGAALFAVWQPIARRRPLPGAEALAAVAARGALHGAGRLSRAVQAGGHPRYLAVVVLAALVAGGAGVLAGPDLRPPAPALEAEGLFAWAPLLLVLAGVAGALRLRERSAKVIALGMVGFGIALFYALFRAPDLVLTQVLVETLSLVLVLVAFARLPALGPDRRPRAQKLAHALVGLALGGAMALLVLGAASAPAPDPSGQEQLARSLPEAKGGNVVNVILVDFRGADTLGEIAVLLVAALGALVLLRPAAVQRPRGGRGTPLLRRTVLGILPATLVFAAYLLWRGHDAPGGGFIAGLVTALAFVLLRLAHGVPRARGAPGLALAAGLLLSTAAAAGTLLLGAPFFTHARLGAPEPLSSLTSTTFLFDLGVFVLVVATAALFARALREGEP